jgi:hypothetical protein
MPCNRYHKDGVTQKKHFQNESKFINVDWLMIMIGLDGEI